MSLNLRSRVPVVCFAAAFVLVAAAASAQISITPPNSVVVRDVASELACAPQTTVDRPNTSLRITGGDQHGKALYGPGDALVLSGGTAQGLTVGQQYFVRRVVNDTFTTQTSGGARSLSIHTAGWVRIVDVSSNAAVAEIVYACDGMLQGDYLEPYVRPAVAAENASAGAPDFTNPGHVILGDERRQMGSAGSLMVLDRGSDHGIRAGVRVTFFRYATDTAGPILRSGEGTVMVVSPETSIVRIDTTRQAVYVGDLVAIHR